MFQILKKKSRVLILSVFSLILLSQLNATAEAMSLFNGDWNEGEAIYLIRQQPGGNFKIQYCEVSYITTRVCSPFNAFFATDMALVPNHPNQIRGYYRYNGKMTVTTLTLTDPNNMQVNWMGGRGGGGYNSVASRMPGAISRPNEPPICPGHTSYYCERTHSCVRAWVSCD
jgi:hypothetical protein